MKNIKKKLKNLELKPMTIGHKEKKLLMILLEKDLMRPINY